MEINWAEILRYWTDIRTKYHLEDNESDSDSVEEEYYDDEIIKDCNRKCRIKIKNLVLNFEISDIQTSPQAEDLIPPDATDLIKDFLDHIIGQFEVEFDDLAVNINDNVTIETSNILVTPEVNGIRKFTIVKDDFVFHELGAKRLLAKKGTEFILMRTIEEYKIKVNVPELYLELAIHPINNVKASTTQSSGWTLPFEITIDLFRVKLADDLILFANDIYLNNSGAFIIGHFESIWKDHQIKLESPVQTQVVRGNFWERDIVIDDEISLKIGNMCEISEIITLLSSCFGSIPNTNAQSKASFIFKLNSLSVWIEEYKTKLLIKELIFDGVKVSISFINLNYNERNLLSLENISYSLHENTFIDDNPFSELKKFIENDEIVSLKAKDLVYSKISDNLVIERISGELIAKDIFDFELGKGSGAQNKLLSIIGKVNQVEILVILPENVTYKLNLIDLKFLKTEMLFDFRIRLNSLIRQANLLMGSADISIVIPTIGMNVIEIDDLSLILPFNFQEQLKSDFSHFFNESNEISQRPCFQLSLKNLKAEFDEAKEPIKTNYLIKELNYKQADESVIYLNELRILLDKKPIFDSGLIIIIFKDDQIEVRNHSSEITLDPKTYNQLLRDIQFWSDVYTPLIEEIEPSAVFHEDERRISDDFTGDISGMLVKVHDEEEEEGISRFELELDMESDEGEEDALNFKSNESQTPETSIDLSLLLKEIDEDFFVNNKLDSVIKIDKSRIQIINLGLNLNLILSDSSFITVSFKGIDGTISRDKINMIVKEGNVQKDDKVVVLTRWPRGPDVTCKFPIEDGNFFNLKSEKLRKEGGIDEFNLSISMSPMRLFLDQKLLNSLISFKIEDLKMKSDQMRAFIFFNKVNINTLALKLDYKPTLQGAEMVLPRIELRGIKGFEGLGPAIMSAWIPEMRGKKLTGVLTTGLVPGNKSLRQGSFLMISVFFYPFSAYSCKYKWRNGRIDHFTLETNVNSSNCRSNTKRQQTDRIGDPKNHHFNRKKHFNSFKHNN